MTINDIFTTCQNIDYTARFLVFDNVGTYSNRENHLYRGQWEELPDKIARAKVIKFYVDNGGRVVYVWISKFN